MEQKLGPVMKDVSLILAGLATPLVLSVHTIVSFDFATSVIPGWLYYHLPSIFRCWSYLLGFCDGSELDVGYTSGLQTRGLHYFRTHFFNE